METDTDTDTITDGDPEIADDGATETITEDGVTDEVDSPAVAPEISISPPSVTRPEGDAGSTAYEFTVTRTGDLSQPSAVGYWVNPTGADPVDGDDFGGIIPRGDIEIEAGAESAVLTIEVEGDLIPEADETFTVSLADLTNSNVVDGEADGTIVNDDEDEGVADPLIPVRITFESTEAGFANAFGIYDKSTMTAELLAPDLKMTAAGEVLYEADLTQQEVDDLGFFLLPDGGDENADLASLVGMELMVENTADGYAVTADGMPLMGAGAPALFSDASLNPDGLDHFFADGPPDGYALSVEDLVGGGDLDFNDAVFTVETGAPVTTPDDLLV